MLHGIPGTGKSLLAKYAIKYLLNREEKDKGGVSFSVLYLTKQDLGKKRLIEKITENLTDDSYEAINVIVIDDCDFMISTRDREPLDRHKDPNKNTGITADLMNLLDNGLPGYTNPLLVIMTTNYLDKVDKAILRPGRTDLCLEVTNIQLETAINMCNYHGVELSDIIKAYPKLVGKDALVNPAELQQVIIKMLSEKGDDRGE